MSLKRISIIILNHNLPKFQLNNRRTQQSNGHLQQDTPSKTPRSQKYTIGEYMKRKQLPILLPSRMSHGRKEDAACLNLYQSFQIRGLPSTLGAKGGVEYIRKSPD